MPIKSGIGVGEAQIFDTSGVIGTYGKILAQQQKADERYAADLADLISKVDTEGVREPDLPEITKYYDAIKNTYRNALSTRNTSDRAMYRAEIANGLNKLNNFAKKSVEFKKEYKNLASEFQKNPWMLDSEKDARLRKMSALPLTQLGEDAVIDPLNWMPKPDNSLLNNLFSDVNSKLKNIAETRMPVSSKSKGGFTYATYGVKPEEADQLIASRLEVSPKAEYSIRNLYSEANPGVTNPSEKDLIKFARSLYESQHGGANAYIFGGGRTKNAVYGGSGSTTDSEKLTYRQQLITGLMDQDDDARQELLANLPANSKVEYHVSKKVPGISKGGYGFVRLVIPAESTENGIEVREDIPLQAGKPIQKLNYIINQYSPEKISPSKVGISGGKPRGEKFNVEEPKTSNKQIKQSDIPSRANAAGYTISEYTELLKKNGIKIIK